MKKYYPLLSILICLLFQSAQAQYCGNSGPSVCIPGGPYPQLGFYPSYNDLPCAVIGQPYDQTIDMQIPATTVVGGLTVSIDSIHIDFVNNLPCGLCWRTDVASNTFRGNSTHCIRISGTTLDAAGQYNMQIQIDVYGKLFGSPVSQMNQNAANFGVKYFAHVQAPGGPCVDIDTLAAGRTASVAGSITTPTITGNNNLCAGQSTTLQVSGTYDTYVWSTGALTQSINTNAAGTYTVTVYDNCSSATASRTVTTTTVNANVTASGSTNLCTGQSLTLDAGTGYSAYNWSNGATTQTITVNQAGTYNATVTQNGCTGTSNTVTVTLTDPQPNITPGPLVTHCAGDSFTLNAGAGFDTYAWSNGATTQTNRVAGNNGVYTVTVTQNGCTATDDVSFSDATPVVDIVANGPTTFCSGGSVTLDAGAGYTAYQWSDNTTGQTITVNSAGTYAVTVTQNNCTASDNINIIVTSNNLTPQITATDTNLCAGGSATLNAGAGYTSYAWSNGDTTAQLSVSPVTTTLYTVTVTQGTCSGTSEVNINVGNFTVPVDVTGTLSICQGQSTVLNAGGGYTTYAWSTGGTAPAIQVNTAGTYAVTVTANACTGADTVVLDVKPLPQPTITPAGTVTICQGETVTLDAGNGFDTYTWTNTANTATIQATVSGTYFVTVTLNGCSGTDSVVVNTTALPQVAISPAGPVNLCQGDDITVDAGNGFDAYAWSTGDTTATLQVNTAGSYIITVTQNGCTGHDTVIVNSVPLPTPVISPAGTVNICEGAAVTVSTGVFDSYSWSNGQTTSSIQVTASGIFNVTVTKNGCSGSAVLSDTINVNPAPVANIDTVIYGSENLIITNSTGTSYRWLRGVSDSLTLVDLGAGTDTLTTLCTSSGYYAVVVTNSFSCKDTSAFVYVSPCTGIDAPFINSLLLQPNPARNVLYVSYQLEKAVDVEVSILDMTGRKVISTIYRNQTTGIRQHSIDIESLVSGIYVVNFNAPNGNFNRKFIKE